MFTNKKWMTLIALLAMAAMILPACARPTPEVIEKEVIVEKPVVETVIVEREKVVEKPVVETVVVLATPEPAKYHEAPMLAELVAKGKLPPVDERLPESRVVVEPFESIGEYGGTLRTMHFWPGAESIKMFLTENPVMLSPDLTEIQPNLFENRGDYSADGMTLTWKLRKGLRWSDGEPFTSADLMWWWEYLVKDERCAQSANPFLYGGGDPAAGIPPKLATLEAPDDYTLVMKLPVPNYVANTVWADGWMRFETNLAPAHYLKQFHPAFNDEYTTCEKLVSVRATYLFDPDYPVLAAWRTVEVVPGEKLILERNPYYWKVDTEGNQLPYIDRIESRYIPDQEARTLTALNGEIDIAVRSLDRRDRTLFLNNPDKCQCRVVPGWMTGGVEPLMPINQVYVGDVPGMAELLRDKNFRRGLSHAIDRQRILNTVWSSLGYVTNSDCVLASFKFDIPDPELAEKTWRSWNDAYIEYDTDKANEYLDAAGLTGRDAQGFRTMPDGSRLEVILTVSSFANEEVNSSAAALTKENWEDVGVRTVITSVPGDAWYTFVQDSKWQVYVGSSATFGEWLHAGHIFLPVNPWEGAYVLPGQWWASAGEAGMAPEPGSPAIRFYELYEESMAAPDPLKRGEILAEAVQLHIDEGPFALGTVANMPELVIARKNLRNIYEYGITQAWTANAPGHSIPAQWYFAQP